MYPRMATSSGHGRLLHIDQRTGGRLRERRPEQDGAEALAGRLRALGDPTRLTLAVALSEAPELCVCDLSWIAERAQNLVSHHMRALRSEGVVRSRREGKMTMYSLTPEGRALVETSLSQLP
jgi:ArsR family transcriptional regulator, lead/cadmium/zinc/bismuth-responsive transcriptional repressor